MPDYAATEDKGGGDFRGPKVRASARMIAALAKQPAWVEGLGEQTRREVVRKLEDSLALCDSPREIASVVRAISMLERNDIDRTRLFLDAEKQDTAPPAAASDIDLWKAAGETYGKGTV
jgi:hypothetical protein